MSRSYTSPPLRLHRCVVGLSSLVQHTHIQYKKCVSTPHTHYERVQYTDPLWRHCLFVAEGLCAPFVVGSYASSSLATGRSNLAGQVKA
jgi:hypothetical protein